MNGYIISLVGVVVIAVYSFLILVIALLINRLLSRFRWKWVVLAPAVLVVLSLPWVEEAWISWHFNEACKDAGVTIYRQVEVEGYFDAVAPSGYEQIRDYGYKFMEHISKTAKKIDHIEFFHGEWKRLTMDHPTARFHFEYAYQPDPYRIEEPIGWKLQKIERHVIDSQTGEVLGRDITIKRVLPTHEALLARLFGPPIRLCPGPNAKPLVPPSPFPQVVLKPISKK